MKRALPYLLVVVASWAGAYLFSHGIQTAIQDNQIAGCERGNALRTAAYKNAVRDAAARRVAARGLTGEPARQLRQLAAAGDRDARSLIAASAPVAAHPGTVKQDCSEAYR